MDSESVNEYVEVENQNKNTNNFGTLDEAVSSIDVETIKRKADEIANTLQKFRANKSTSLESISSDPPAEFIHHHERSLYVAKKLEEDRRLFEESKRRSIAMHEKVRDAKEAHKHLLEMEKECKKYDTGGNNQINILKLKIEKLESTIQHLQDCLKEKNQTISENNQTIRFLNETVSDTYDAHMKSLELSNEEIKRLTADYSSKFKVVNDSKEELLNQLQIIRKKYILMENDLKLSDFSRCRLVTRNKQLQDKISALENENNELRIMLSEESKSDIQDMSVTVDAKHLLEISILRPKIECLETISNEFWNFISDNSTSISDHESDTSTDSEEYVIKTADKITEKLESSFYIVRDKLSAFDEMQDKLKNTSEKLSELESSYNEVKQHELKLKKLLASIKQKAQNEANINKDLTKELAATKECIKDHEALKLKYEHLQFELEEVTNKLNALQNEKEEDVRLTELNNECIRLQNENTKLTASIKILQQANVDDVNDKFENGFVVLQNAGQETESWQQKWIILQDEYNKLLEIMHVANEKNIEQENEKLKLKMQTDELNKRTIELEKICEIKTNNEFLKQEEIEKLRTELHTMSNKLDVLEDQLISDENLLREEQTECNKLKIYSDTLLRTLQEKDIVIKDMEEKNITLSDECEKLKNKLQRLQLYCKANLNKSGDKNASHENAESKKLQERLTQTLDKLQNQTLLIENLTMENEKLKNTNEQLSFTLNEVQKLNEHLQNKLTSSELTKTNYDKIENIYVPVESQSNNDNLCSVSAIDELADSLNEAHSFAMLSEFKKDEYLKLENEQLYAANERLSQALNEARKIAKEQSENSVETDELKSENEQLRKINENLSLALNEAQETAKELLTEKDELHSINTQLEQNMQSKIIELEQLLNDSEQRGTVLQAHVDQLDQIKRKCEDLQISNMLEALEQIEQYRYGPPSVIIEREELLEQTRFELCDTRRKLQLAYEQIQELQKQSLLRDHVAEIDELKDVVVNISNDNQVLRDHCDEYRSKYIILCNRIRQIIQQVDDISHSMIESVNKLQFEDNALKPPHDQDSTLENLRVELIEQGNKFNAAMVMQQQQLDDFKSRCLTLENELLEKQISFENYKDSVEEFMDQERKNYEQYIHELEQRRPESIDAAVQIDENSTTTKLADYFSVSSNDITEFNIKTEESQNETSSISNIINYCKGKITKEISDILKPDETVHETEDYSRYLLPYSLDKECQTSSTFLNNNVAATQTVEQSSMHNVMCQSSDLFDIKETATQTVEQSKMRSVMCQSSDLFDIKETTTQTMCQMTAAKEVQTNVINFDSLVQANKKSDTDSITQTIGVKTFDEQTQTSAEEEKHELHLYTDSVVQTEQDDHTNTISVIELVDRLKNIIESKSQECWSIEDDDYAQLEMDNAYFTDTAFKFAELTELVLRYYLKLCEEVPNNELIINRFREAVSAVIITKLPQQVTDNYSSDSFTQLIVLAIRFEFENRYLINTLSYVETLFTDFIGIPSYHFCDILTSWREDVNLNSVVQYLSDTISESYGKYNKYEENEILPEPCVKEFNNLCNVWKQNLQKLVQLCDVNQQSENIHEMFKILENLKYKIQQLMSDIHDNYVSGKMSDTVIFFKQIEEVNQWIEYLLKTITGEILKEKKAVNINESKIKNVSLVPSEKSSEDEFETVAFADKATLSAMLKSDDDDDEDHETVIELKTLLNESNRKIDNLVRELMQIKNSREYNEVQQLRTKLDETLYQLHMQDVHCVELTRELTQLLSERDSLQLKLSTIIRQNEQLKQASFSNPRENLTSHMNLENKLEELHGVDYMKDPHISEKSKHHHTSQMQLFNEEQFNFSKTNKENSENAGFSMPSLFKWFTGDSDINQ